MLVFVDLFLNDLSNGVSDSLGLWQTAGHLVVANDKHVTDSGVEDVTSLVLQSDDSDVSELLDNGHDGSDSSQVVAHGDESLVSDCQGEVLLDGVVLEVVLDGVTDMDVRVRESDCSGIMSHCVRDLVGTDLDLDDLAELVVQFLVLDLQESESSSLIVEHSELVSGLRNSNNVHQSDWELRVSSHLAINLDLVFLVFKDLGDFLVVQGVAKLSTKNNLKWNALFQFVWTLARSGSL